MIKREHNKKIESGGKLWGTDKSQSEISSTLFQREATQNPIIITLLPARKDKPALISDWLIQVNLCQKLLFLHQLNNNMTTDCSLNYKFNTWKLQAQNMFSLCSAKEELLTKIYLYSIRTEWYAKRQKIWQKCEITCILRP